MKETPTPPGTSVTPQAAFSVLFLCMGNICRSPTAHGVFRHKVKEARLEHLVNISSAGTHKYHPGKPPDQQIGRAHV